jgi:hypothetical protein
MNIKLYLLDTESNCVLFEWITDPHSPSETVCGKFLNFGGISWNKKSDTHLKRVTCGYLLSVPSSLLNYDAIFTSCVVCVLLALF